MRTRHRQVIRRDGGQALVFLLVWLAALAGVFVMVWDSGRAAAQKQQMLNVADAAAYSAAVLQARALNFTAYTNRALVANDAAFAQSVSLASWSDHMNRQLPRLAVLTHWLPYLGAATSTLQRFWRGYDGTLQAATTAAEAQLALANGRLVAAQQFMQAAALVALRPSITESIDLNSTARESPARLSQGGELLVAQAAARIGAFSTRYAGPQRSRQRDVVLAARDGFSRRRNQRLGSGLAGSVFRFEKRGGTELVNFETWRGIDTHSLHLRQGLLFGSLRERVVISWGAASSGAATGAIVRGRGLYGDSHRINPRASAQASRILRRRALYRGLPAMHDLSEAMRRDYATPRIALRIAAPQWQGLRDRARSEPFYADAAAEIRFQRPLPRRDGLRELPSLYAPFWKAALAPVSRSERMVGALADGAAASLALP